LCLRRTGNKDKEGEDEEEEDDDDDGDITQEPWYEGSVQRGALPLFTSSGVMRGQEGDSGQEFFLLQLPQGLPQCVSIRSSCPLPPLPS
jgi:hypothetical protein